jgi:ankyrin repeat protein
MNITYTEEDYFFIQELQIKKPNELIEICNKEIKSKNPRLSIVKSIISLIEVDSLNEDGLSPLHIAIFYEQTEIIRLLLQRGANPFLLEIPYETIGLQSSLEPTTTPFNTATSIGNIEIIELILNHKDYSGDIEKDVYSLCTSILNDHLDVLQMIIPYFKNLNVPQYSILPIFYAVQNKNPEFTQILLERGANPRVVNGFDNTPLHYAVSSNHLKVAKVLLQYDVDIHHKNEYGNTPLDWAKNYKRMTKLLNNYKIP